MFWRRNVRLNFLDEDKGGTRDDPVVFDLAKRLRVISLLKCGRMCKESLGGRNPNLGLAYQVEDAYSDTR